MAIRPLFQRLISRRFLRWVLLAILISSVFALGLQLRHWTWQKTRHVRFQHDIVNGFYWGSETLKEARKLLPTDSSADSWSTFFRGYFALYDHVKDDAYENDYGLDYPPLRLLIMSIWAKQVRDAFPGVDDGHPEHVKPLLNINLFCELLSAVAIFFLVRLCVKPASNSDWRGLPQRLPTENRAWICGLAAASVAWLEPSTILDAHGWPQWDIWIVPFYLFAVLAALKNRWLTTGCLLAAGAMFKGQLLFVAPFFVLWPLWEKSWIRALCVLAGFAATAAAIVSPWLLRTPAAWIAVVAGAGSSLLALFDSRMPHRGAWIAGITGGAVFVIGALTGGSFTWLQLGFIYGSEHYPYLFISSCYNLPLLLSKLGWSLKDPFWSAHFGSIHLQLTLQWALRLFYLGALALCAHGIARLQHDREPRVLIAIAAPWLLMFALLGQMHERYLMWGAVLSAVALGVSFRLSAIHFIISAASAAMIVHVMLIDKKLEATLPAIHLLKNIRPYASGVVLACVGVYLWSTISTRLPVLRRHTATATAMPRLSLAAGPEEA